jgi:serine/threonine protein phosphatase PrpC
MLSDDEVLQAVLQGGTPEEICHRLVSQANERGGVDNITVVLILLQREEKTFFQKLFKSKS